MISMGILIVILVILFGIPFVAGFTGNYGVMKLYGVKYTKAEEQVEQEETNEQERLQEINRNERIEILENTLVEYNKLIETLTKQYNLELNEKKKAILLRQKITALEKYNRALEKIEKMNI